MKNSFNLLIICFIFVFLALGCDGVASARGKVLDENGQPIPDARIILETDEEKFEGKSDERGNYDVGGVVPPFETKTKLTVIKNGYAVFEETFESQMEIKKPHDVILKKN